MFLYLLLLVSNLMVADHPVRHVKQVVLWGHKLHSHTHSYIHFAFERAFKHLGYKTLWLDDNDSIRGFDFRNSLFITEGQVDSKIPISKSSYYIIHNCDLKKYQQLLERGNCIILQVYTNKCLKDNVIKYDDFIYFNLEDKKIYMPWATDLLPYEIDVCKKRIPTIQKLNKASFIGSLGPVMPYGNSSMVDPFIAACKERNIPFEQKGGTISFNQHVNIIQQALLAPAIVGQWQRDEGYIPCRIFKNISYGALGITNSKEVYELFDQKIVYNKDTHQLCFDALDMLKTWSLQDQYELMDFVKEKHTYINRIAVLFDFFEKVQIYSDVSMLTNDLPN